MNTHAFVPLRLILPIVFLASLICASAPCVAQRAPGDVGIGVHIGEPTGVTLKVYNPGTSIDFLAAWDLENFFFLNIHAIYDAHLNDAQTIHFFYGPGGFIGIHNRPEGLDDEVDVGVSGDFGLDFLIRKFEIFMQLTPRLSLVRTTNFDLGGGAGFRVYF